MNDLQMVALLIGVVLVLLSLPCIFSTPKAMDWIRDFPRSKFAAWIITAIGTTWVAWLLFQTPLAWFDKYKPALYMLAPAFFLIVVNYMDELLAPRALGGFLLLIPNPIIEVARQRGLLLVSIAYLLVVAGIILVLSPYMFRKTMAYWIASTARCRILGYLFLGCGIFVSIFGLLFY